MSGLISSKEQSENFNYSCGIIRALRASLSCLHLLQSSTPTLTLLPNLPQLSMAHDPTSAPQGHQLLPQCCQCSKQGWSSAPHSPALLDHGATLRVSRNTDINNKQWA